MTHYWQYCMLAFFTGYIVFAIGFADADYGELVSIASKPSERHVFFVDDLDAFKKIEEKLVTFVCEAATASESYIRVICKQGRGILLCLFLSME